MDILFNLVWRNIWRHPRRSVLNVSLIAIGLALVIFLVALTDAMHDQMLEAPIKLGTGHLQVHAEGYHDDPVISKVVDDPQAIVDVVRKDSRVVAAAKRVVAPALLSAGETSTGGQITGIEPAPEADLSIVHEHIVTGSYLQSGDGRQAIVGRQLAENLGIGVGDELVMLTQDYYGAISAEVLQVQGIFKTGIPEMDAYQVFVPLHMLQDLLVVEGVHEIAVKLSSAEYAEGFKRDLAGKLQVEQDLELMTWREILENLIRALDLDNAGMYIFLVILLVVVAGGLLNEVLMNSLERTREIGVLRALGVKPNQVRRLIVLEALFLGCVGTVIGIMLGSTASWLLSMHPIYIASWGEYAAEYGLINPYLTAKLTWINIALSSFFMLVISVLAGIVPAYRAGRIRITRALRHA